MRDENQLRHVIELARREINQQKPLVAIRRLDEIHRAVEDCSVALLLAEYQLAYAEALSAKRDTAALPEFEYALRLILNLPERNALLEMRAFEHFASLLFSRRRFSRAFEQATSAKKIAVELKLLDDSARIQLLLTSITYEIDKNPLQPDFQQFKSATDDLDCTAQEQLAAWSQYVGNSDTRKDGLFAAREQGSKEFFKRLLKSVREERQHEIED